MLKYNYKISVTYWVECWYYKFEKTVWGLNLIVKQ